MKQSEKSKFNLGGFTGLLSLDIKSYFIRSPLGFLFGSLYQLGLIVVLWMVGGENYLPIALAGAIVYQVLLMGIGQLPMDFLMINNSGYRSLLVVSPVNTKAVMIAETIGPSTNVLIQLFFVSSILIVLKKVQLLQIGIMCIALLIMWFIGIFFGFYVATTITNPGKLRQSTQILMLIFGTFVPVYYPITALPYLLQLLVMLIPTTDVAIIIRNALGYSDVVGGIPLVTYWVLLLIWLGIGLLFNRKTALEYE